jgi:RecA-superfamily ATPases implicated in signal transduction
MSVLPGKRVKVGIVGLDDMLGGGLIPGSICAVIGMYGTGKTTFSLEFVWDGIKRSEKVIYISLEERETRDYRVHETEGLGC